MDTTKLGRQGEEAAAVFLKEAGYEILARNFRTPRGEIDIVAGTGQTVAFIEVKTRRTRRFGRPAAAVDCGERQKIIHSALWFLRQRHLDGCLCRFDVIEVCVAGERWEIHHLPGAFET